MDTLWTNGSSFINVIKDKSDRKPLHFDWPLFMRDLITEASVLQKDFK